MLHLLFCIIFYFVESIPHVDSRNSMPPCAPNDVACMEKKANAIYQIIMKGDPERHIEPHEPLFHDYIEGNLSVLKYKYYNSTYIGLDTCKIKNLSWDAKSSTMRFDYECAPIKIDGKYEITGRLIILPIEGKGDYEIQTNGYRLQVECEMNIAEKADGTKYWHINSYKLDATATGPLVFAYTNLFNGQKDLYNYGLSLKGKLEEFVGEDKQKHVKVKNFIPTPYFGGPVVYNTTDLFYGNEMLASEALKYINSNWKAESEFGQSPMLSAVRRPFFKNINKCLKPIPVQNIVF